MLEHLVLLGVANLHSLWALGFGGKWLIKGRIVLPGGYEIGSTRLLEPVLNKKQLGQIRISAGLCKLWG
jgi:hypothetical protein